MSVIENTLFEKIKTEYNELLQELKNCREPDEIKELEKKEKVISCLNKSLTKYIQYNHMKDLKKNVKSK